MAAGRSSKRPGGRILADALVAQGIDHVFAVPGESYLDVLDGLYSVQDRVRLVTCRFEAGAVNMAEAFGKLMGRPAAAMVTRGPGACHGAIGVHVAMQDSTPMLLFIGQIPFGETDRDSFQEVDYRRMFGPLAKWVTQIDDARRIPELVAHAVDVATTGRPGPVVIALSEEMQKEEVAVRDVGRMFVSRPQPEPEAMRLMAERLEASERPLVILGGSGWSAGGRAAVRDFAVRQGLPVAVGFRRQGVFDGRLANFVGDLGVGSDPALVTRAREADLVLAIGSRLGEATSQGYTLFEHGGGVPIIQVHQEPSEIGRVFRPVLGIAADLNAFAQAAAGLPKAGRDWRAWTEGLRALRQAGREVPDYPGPLNLAQVMHDIQALAAADAVFTSDAGNFAAWPARFIDFGEEQRFIGPTNGAMGYGVPAGVAAAIACPGRQVIVFVGDGGMLMTGQEVATAFQEGVSPILLVFNNAMYGTIRMYQERAYPGRVSGTRLTNPDFVRWIEAFGGYGEVVERTGEFAPAFRRAAASGKPALIELRVDAEQITSRTTITELRGRAGR